MSNLNDLILTAADYNTVFSFNDVNGAKQRYLLQTTSELNYDLSKEGEYIYAVGTTEPIGNKGNAKSYKGGWSLQTGELNAILQLGGFNNAVDIEGATLSIAALVGGFSLVFKDVNILGNSGGITAKAKETISKLSFQAIGLA